MVIVELPDLVLSAIDVAVRVTVGGFGAVAGAVTVTDVVVTFVNAPQEEPVQPLPDKAQVTPLVEESF